MTETFGRAFHIHRELDQRDQGPEAGDAFVKPAQRPVAMRRSRRHQQLAVATIVAPAPALNPDPNVIRLPALKDTFTDDVMETLGPAVMVRHLRSLVMN